ncbi:MAG: helix-turn-helix transcriptional regulator [Cytophagales bacterium]|nr:helix-turn-helix transcriptional regulator [Cytophagales bacterium]
MQDELIGRIGKRIKALRKVRGLTLQALSERARITKGLLSKIENSRTIPSLPVFLQVVRSLEVTTQDFFEDLKLVQGKSYLLIRKSDYQPVQKEERPGFFYQSVLTQHLQPNTMDVVLLSIEPRTQSQATTTDGFEFKHIISGRCLYRIEDEELLLQEGDSLYFDASRPHHPINPFRKKVTMLVFYFLTSK